MIKIKLTSLFLAVIYASLVVSCGESGSVTDTQSTTAMDLTSASESVVLESDLPERDFGGYDFKFLNGNVYSWFTVSSVIVEEQTGETLNDAIYMRNRKVEERYNITLSEIPTSSAMNDYLKSITAGDNSFDIALLRMEWALPVVLQNGSVNWIDIPNLELDKPWWVQGSLSSMSLMNNIYFGVSLFDTTHFDSVRVLYFNKNMLKDFNLESPYELVSSGKWTLGKFHEMGLIAANDLNGNNEWDDDDRYGYAGTPNITGNTLMCGVGAILSIGKDANDIPYFDLDNERAVERLRAVAGILGAGDGFTYRGSDYSGTFRSGRLLFLSELIYGAVSMRDMEDDFGIIPAPKYDESQEEYINLGGSPFFMTIPITAENLDRTGAIMEALAYDSMGLIDTAMYDILLKGKASRDDESMEMLDLIFSTLQYYHPLANSHLNAPLADKYIWNGNTDFTSYFASVKETIRSEIDNALATYAENVK